MGRQLHMMPTLNSTILGFLRLATPRWSYHSSKKFIHDCLCETQVPAKITAFTGGSNTEIKTQDTSYAGPVSNSQSC